MANFGGTMKERWKPLPWRRRNRAPPVVRHPESKPTSPSSRGGLVAAILRGEWRRSADVDSANCAGVGTSAAFCIVGQQPAGVLLLVLMALAHLVLLLWKQRRRIRAKDATAERQKLRRQATSTSSPSTTEPTEAEDVRRRLLLGSRGQETLSQTVPYIRRHIRAFALGLYDASSNPTGFITLCVAENKVAIDLLLDRFLLGPSSSGVAAAFANRDAYGYTSTLGLPAARQAAAHFLERRFLRRSWADGEDEEPDSAACRPPVLPEHVALGAGCAPLLNHLFFLLGDAGDCCLIPAPYYAAFENDMNMVAGIVPMAVYQDDPSQGPTIDELERAYNQAQRLGFEPRFLLLTNPHNPLGCIYAPSVVREAVEWARSHDMHTIVDEIYALSVQPLEEEDHQTEVDTNCESCHGASGHGNSHVGFQSVLEILDNDLQTNVHFVWALSKDFGASGLRFGVLYTQNELLLQGLATVNAFTGVSGPVQLLVAEALMLDDRFVDHYLQESRKRLRDSYRLCTRALLRLQLPFVPARAGVFLYSDLSSLLPEPTYEWEDTLSRVMFHYARIIFTPGESQRDHRPGHFRLCYAWVPLEALQVAMERLARLVTTIRASGLESFPLNDDDDEGAEEGDVATESVLDTKLRDAILGPSFHFV